jgi:DNA polymerase III epsilon subunit-like protein
MSTKQQAIRFGLCIDWETSGSDWGKDSSINYQGISFGAIVFNAENFDELESLHLHVKFDSSKYKWSIEAENIHGITKEYLDANGVSQEDAAIALAELILKYWGPDGKVLMLGHNTEFDRRFTNQLLNTIGIEYSIEKETKLDSWIQVHHVLLDTSSCGYITFGLYKSDLLFEKVGCPERGKHNALDDARQTLLVCKTIRELINFSLLSMQE